MSDPSAYSTYGVPPSNRAPIHNNNNNFNNNLDNMNTSYPNHPTTGPTTGTGVGGGIGRGIGGATTTNERPPDAGTGTGIGGGIGRGIGGATTTNERLPGTGTGTGTSKFRGAVEVTHGLGESIRGTAMGALDNALNTRNPTGTGMNKNEEIARSGKLEMEQGLAKLRGSGSSGGVTGASDYGHGYGHGYDSAGVGGNTASYPTSATGQSLGGNFDHHPYPANVSGKTGTYHQSADDEYNNPIGLGGGGGGVAGIGRKFGTGAQPTTTGTSTGYGTGYQHQPPLPPRAQGGQNARHGISEEEVQEIRNLDSARRP